MERIAIKHLERIFKGLANRRRLAIIKLLMEEKELPVAEIARRIGLSFTSTSKHLSILRSLDIIDYRQESLVVYNRLSAFLPPAVRKVLSEVSNSRE